MTDLIRPISRITAINPDPRAAQRFVERKPPKPAAQKDGRVPVDEVTLPTVAASIGLVLYKIHPRRQK